MGFRDKGKRYENCIARLFRKHGWTDAKRHLEYQSSEASFGRDLDGTQPFAVQIKCWKKAPPITVLNEVSPSDEYPFPIAILKRTMSKDISSMEVVVIPLPLFLAMARLLKDDMDALAYAVGVMKDV